MILTFVLMAELVLLMWAQWRSGFMLFPHGIMIYIIGAQVFLWLNATERVNYQFLQLWTSGAYQTHFNSLVLMFFAFYLGAAACIPNTRVDLTRIFANLRLRDVGIVSALTIALLYAHLFVYWMYLDWGTAWSTDRYLEMGSPTGQESLLGVALMRSERVFGMLAVILATYLAWRRRWDIFPIVLPIVLWHVLFDMAAHSRAVVLYSATAGLSVLVLRPRYTVGLTAGFGVAFFVTLLGSLSGRGSGHHGFTSLPAYFTNIVTRPIEFGDLTNIFEGIFVTAEYFRGGLDYPIQYKILSLSPLFSFMDGYEAVRLQSQIRVHAFVPESAVSEVLAFGLVYAVVYFGTQFLAGWLSARLLAREQSLPALFINAFVLLAAYLQFTYSVRTIFRFFVIAAVVSAVLLYRSTRIRSAKASAGEFKKPSGRRHALAEAALAATGSAVSAIKDSRARRATGAAMEGTQRHGAVRSNPQELASSVRVAAVAEAPGVAIRARRRHRAAQA